LGDRSWKGGWGGFIRGVPPTRAFSNLKGVFLSLRKEKEKGLGKRKKRQNGESFCRRRAFSRGGLH